MTRRTALWLIVALLGIAASAAVGWAATRLTGQRIGLSSAPPSAVRGLAPLSPPGSRRRPGHAPKKSRVSTSGGSRGGALSLTAPRPSGDDSSVSTGGESAGPDD
jgi:hypothetical protein